MEFSTPPDWTLTHNLLLQESYVYFVIVLCSQGTGTCRFRRSEWAAKFNINPQTLNRYIEKICDEGYAREIDEEGLKKGEVCLALPKWPNSQNRNFDYIGSMYTKDTTCDDNTGNKVTKVNKVDMDADDIFAFWIEERNKVLFTSGRGPKIEKATIKKPRISRIRARLNDGYSVEDIKDAIRGCMSREHNVEGGYLDIDLICKPNKIDMFISHWKRQQEPSAEPEYMREWTG